MEHDWTKYLLKKEEGWILSKLRGSMKNLDIQLVNSFLTFDTADTGIYVIDVPYVHR